MSGGGEQLPGLNVYILMRLLILLSMGAGLALGADELGGQWSFRLMVFGEPSYARVTLQEQGGKLTGTLNELKLEGAVKGDSFTLKATRPNGNDWGTFEGKQQSGNELRGTARRPGGEALEWIAKRIDTTRPTPRTHKFEPTKFHRLFSGTIEPALHINPGDTVQTTTVDAGGRDASNKALSMGGNPETGPFYVDGALPGDTLVVKLKRVRLNRDSAGSGNRIVSMALRADYLRDAKYTDDFNSEWKLDRQAGTATLAKPTERLKNYKVMLQPMLGCVGVAPPGKQAFRAGWLGPWGGNMDYSGVKEGTTIYLPVFQEGALLFVGDGHAQEGDGELNGDALETSMDVEFSVDLVRDENTGGPRFEDDEYLMASGIAGSLGDALQSATTELARWIEKEYKLSASESNIVLGTAIRYDVAEIVDPQVHIVAKIKKSVLAPLKP